MYGPGSKDSLETTGVISALDTTGEILSSFSPQETILGVTTVVLLSMLLSNPSSQ